MEFPYVNTADAHIGHPTLFDVVSLAKLQVQEWFIVGRISMAAGSLLGDRVFESFKSVHGLCLGG